MKLPGLRDLCFVCRGGELGNLAKSYMRHEPNDLTAGLPRSQAARRRKRRRRQLTKKNGTKTAGLCQLQKRTSSDCAPPDLHPAVAGTVLTMEILGRNAECDEGDARAARESLCENGLMGLAAGNIRQCCSRDCRNLQRIAVHPARQYFGRPAFGDCGMVRSSCGQAVEWGEARGGGATRGETHFSSGHL